MICDDMKIDMVGVNELKPYEKNPRKNNKAIEPVMKSLKEYGFQQPIVVDKDNVIVVGHTRLEAAKKLGYKEVPVFVATNLSND